MKLTDTKPTRRNPTLTEHPGEIPYRKTALLLTLALAAIAVASLLWILLNTSPKQEGMIADIYQNGVLLQSIPLSSVEEPYCFTATGSGNEWNEIQVCPDGICILSASCPDGLCVKQGFINTSLLPITCLPNRLVIQLRPAQSDNESIYPQGEIVPDSIAY